MFLIFTFFSPLLTLQIKIRKPGKDMTSLYDVFRAIRADEGDHVGEEHFFEHHQYVSKIFVKFSSYFEFNFVAYVNRNDESMFRPRYSRLISSP